MKRKVYLIASFLDNKIYDICFAENEEQVRTVRIVEKAKGRNVEVRELQYENKKERKNEACNQTNKNNTSFGPNVKCVETGQVYINTKQCSEHMKLSTGYVRSSLINEHFHRKNGYNFVYTNENLTVEPKPLRIYDRRSTWPGAFKVLCQQTKKVYESVRDAAKDSGLTMQHIYNSIRYKREYSGLTFVKVE